MRTECFLCGAHLGGAASIRGTSHGLCVACAQQLTGRLGRARWRSRLREVADGVESAPRGPARVRRLVA